MNKINFYQKKAPPKKFFLLLCFNQSRLEGVVAVKFLLMLIKYRRKIKCFIILGFLCFSFYCKLKCAYKHSSSIKNVFDSLIDF